MAEVRIISVISKLRPKVVRGRTVDLDALAEEIAEQSGFDLGGARHPEDTVIMRDGSTRTA